MSYRRVYQWKFAVVHEEFFFIGFRVIKEAYLKIKSLPNKKHNTLLQRLKFERMKILAGLFALGWKAEKNVW